MILETGTGADRIYWDVSSDFDVWVDAGGVDTLVVPEGLFFQADRKLVFQDGVLSFTENGRTLEMPGGTSTAPAIEFIEFTSDLSLPAPGSEAVLARLTILPLPETLTGQDFAAIGTREGDIITAPDHGVVISGFSQIFGNGGDDVIRLSPTQSSSAYGGQGNDRIIAQGDVDAFLSGVAGQDRLVGADGDDTLFGGRGSDKLFGRGGDDILTGDPLFPPGQFVHSDRLVGGKGDDILAGGSGIDRLTGGKGSDQFDFFLGENAGGFDRITDFDPTRDSIFINLDTRQGKVVVETRKGDTFISFDSARLGPEFDLGIARLKDIELTKSQIEFDFL